MCERAVKQSALRYQAIQRQLAAAMLQNAGFAAREALGSVQLPVTAPVKVQAQGLGPGGQICGLDGSMNLKYEQLQWRM